MVFFVLYLLLCFARSSTYHHAHTIDTWLFVLWIFWLLMQHCQKIAMGSVNKRPTGHNSLTWVKPPLQICRWHATFFQYLAYKVKMLKLQVKQVTPNASYQLFWVNWHFGAAEEAKNRFSRWLPSWISDRNDYSYFLIYKSPWCFLLSFKSIDF